MQLFARIWFSGFQLMLKLNDQWGSGCTMAAFFSPNIFANLHIFLVVPILLCSWNGGVNLHCLYVMLLAFRGREWEYPLYSTHFWIVHRKSLCSQMMGLWKEALTKSFMNSLIFDCQLQRSHSLKLALLLMVVLQLPQLPFLKFE